MEMLGHKGQTRVGGGVSLWQVPIPLERNGGLAPHPQGFLCMPSATDAMINRRNSLLCNRASARCHEMSAGLAAIGATFEEDTHMHTNTGGGMEANRRSRRRGGPHSQRRKHSGTAARGHGWGLGA
eukprot:1161911-Pelagomonas_calceolata.AAC.3